MQFWQFNGTCGNPIGYSESNSGGQTVGPALSIAKYCIDPGQLHKLVRFAAVFDQFSRRKRPNRLQHNQKEPDLWQIYPDHWTNPFPILFGAGLWGDDAFPGVESSWAQPSRQLAIKLTSTLSNTSINEVQFSYSANRINVTPGSGGDLNRQINTAIPGFFPDSAKVAGLDRPHPVFWGGLAPYTSNRGADLWTEAPFHNSLDIYSIRDDFSKVMGNHSFKTGFLLDKARKIEDAGPANESTQFWGTTSWLPGTYSTNNLYNALTPGDFFGFNESDKEAVAHTHYTNLEFYLGDSWKVKQNVTLELAHVTHYYMSLTTQPMRSVHFYHQRIIHR